MPLTLTFMGPIERPDEARRAGALAGAATVDQLLAALGYAPAHRRFIRVATIAGGPLRPHDPLPADGELVLSVPMGGG